MSGEALDYEYTMRLLRGVRPSVESGIGSEEGSDVVYAPCACGSHVVFSWSQESTGLPRITVSHSNKILGSLPITDSMTPIKTLAAMVLMMMSEYLKGCTEGRGCYDYWQSVKYTVLDI